MADSTPAAFNTAPPGRILVVVTRRIGDVLLATPLMRSLRRAWPRAEVDALVFRGTAGVLAANPDLSRVIEISERPGFIEHLRLYARLFRHYDLALSVQPGDRPTLYAWAAGRQRMGLQPAGGAAWKKSLLTQWAAYDDNDTHTVRMNLALADRLGIPSIAEVVAAYSDADREALARLWPEREARPYAVLHPYPKFNYKMWTPAAWRELADWLQSRGLSVVLNGGPAADERAYVDALAAQLAVTQPPARNLCGALTLGQTACLLAGAALYCGPDTATTHMAAALNVPTVALFGPSNPVKWGPWPYGQPAAHNPWTRVGSQRSGNVALVQGAAACAPGVPCLAEGCERHIESYSLCLQQLPAARVIAAAEAVLNG